MAEYHFPVPGSIDEKKIVLFVRKHWAAYLGQFALSVFLFFFPLALLLVIYLNDRTIFTGLVLNLIVLGASTYYLIITTFIFTSWLSFYYDIYIVTDESIIDVFQQGFFGRKIVQISLLRVQDVSSNIQGLLPTLFAYGNILIETAGEQTQNLLFEQVPNPQEVSAKIMEMHRKLVEVEGRRPQMLEAEGVLVPAPQPISKEAVKEPEKTKYQELLEKDRQGENIPSEGEIKSDDLNKGGEVDFK